MVMGTIIIAKAQVSIEEPVGEAPKEIPKNYSVTDESTTNKEDIILREIGKETVKEGENRYKTTYTFGAVNMPDRDGNLVRVEDNINITLQDGLLTYAWNEYFLTFKPILTSKEIDYWIGYDAIAEKAEKDQPLLTIPIVKKDGWVKYDLNLTNYEPDDSLTLQLNNYNINFSELTAHETGYEYNHTVISFNPQCNLYVDKSQIILRNLSKECLDPTVEYNYSVQNNIFAEEGDSCAADPEPPNNGPFNATTLCGSVRNMTADSDIRFDDGLREQSDINAWHHFWVNATEKNDLSKNITLLSWTWNGRCDSSSCSSPNNDFDVYVWNYSSNTWIPILSDYAGEFDITINALFSANNLTDVMNSTGYTHMLAYMDPVTARFFETDFVKFEVTYNQLIPSFNNISINVNTSQSYAFAVDKLNYSVGLGGNFSTQNVSIQYLNQTNNPSGAWAKVREQNFTCTGGTTCTGGDSINGTDLRAYQNWTITAYAWNAEVNSGWVNATSLTINATLHSLNFTSPSDTNGSTFIADRNYIITNITASGDAKITMINITLYNATHIINITNATNMSIDINYTGLSNGTYRINATILDIAGNQNKTETREYKILLPQPSTPSIIVNTSLSVAYAQDSLNCSVLLNNVNANISFKWFNRTNSTANNFTIVPSLSSNISCAVGNTCYPSIILSNVTLRHFQNWTCEARPYINNTLFESLNSTAKYINNSIPTLLSVSISPSIVLDNDIVDCTGMNAMDNDVDDLNVTYYQWFNSSDNNNFQPMNVMNTSGLLSAANTYTNQYIKCNAWVNDTYSLSVNRTSSVKLVGSSNIAPGGIIVNVTKFNTNILSDSNNPQKNNSYIVFNINYSEPNNDKTTIHICKSQGFSNGNCTGQYFIVSDVNTTNRTLSYEYDKLGYSIGVNNYYVYIIDNQSLVSDEYSNSFEVNNPPEITSLTSPSDSTSFSSTTNSVKLLYNSTDLNNDNINYIIYGDANTNPSTIINYTSSTSHNWTGLSSGTTYYWKVVANDSHGFTSAESEVLSFEIGTGAGTTPTAGPGSSSSNSQVFSIVSKKSCNIEIKPRIILIDSKDSVQKLTIINNEDTSINPTFQVNEETLVSIQGFASQLILPKNSLELSIVYNKDSGLQGEKITSILLKSDGCDDIIIPVDVKGYAGIGNSIKGKNFLETMKNLFIALKNELLAIIFKIPLGAKIDGVNRIVLDIRFIYIVGLTSLLVGYFSFFIIKNSSVSGKVFIFVFITTFLSIMIRFVLVLFRGG